MIKRILTAALAACLLCTPAYAELYEEYPVFEEETISITDEEIAAFAARLETAERNDSMTFEIINTFYSGGEQLSTDYDAGGLNVYNGIATVTQADAELLDTLLADAGLENATDAEKLAWCVEWIHNNFVYDAPHSGDYVYSAFVERGGQCNIYNGAVCALATYLGYRVQLVRGYRGSTGSETGHWWGELILQDGTPLVLETGSLEDGYWYYLGATYAETHGTGRDYIKCNAYAYNGEDYHYYGAAAYPDAPQLTPENAVLKARIAKGEGYEVSEVGLLLGDTPDSLERVAYDEVATEYNLANEGGGFSVSYDLSDYDITLSPGQTCYYAFYVVVAGTTCEGETTSFTLPTPPPRPTPRAHRCACSRAAHRCRVELVLYSRARSRRAACAGNSPAGLPPPPPRQGEKGRRKQRKGNRDSGGVSSHYKGV